MISSSLALHDVLFLFPVSESILYLREEKKWDTQYLSCKVRSNNISYCLILHKQKKEKPPCDGWRSVQGILIIQSSSDDARHDVVETHD